MMEQPHTLSNESNKPWIGFAIWAMSILFLLEGIWKFIAGLMHWSNGAITLYLHLTGISFDILAFAQIMIGFSLLLMEESGRKNALILLWINLLGGILVSIIVALVQRNWETAYSFAGAYYSSQGPFVFFLLSGGILALRTGLILFFSARETKEFIKN